MNFDGLRVLVVGAGGIGGFFGAVLARAGVDVTFVARGVHLEAIRRNGFRVQSETYGNWSSRAPALAASDVATYGKADLVWIAVKAMDTVAACDAVAPAVGNETLLMSLQNGVESEPLMISRFSADRVLGAMTVLAGAHLTEPGAIAHTGESRLVFGEYPRGLSPRTEVLAAFLVGKGVRAILSEKIEAELWKKLMLNNAANGLSGLTHLDTHDLTHFPETRDLFLRMMREVYEVGARLGVDLSPGDPEEMLALLSGFAPFRTSMLHDIERGRPFEVEAIVGVIVREARRLGIPAPVNDLVHALLQARYRRITALDHSSA